MVKTLLLSVRLYGSFLGFITLYCISCIATAQSSQIITKLAGTFYWGDGGSATDANIQSPRVIALFYLTDATLSTIATIASLSTAGPQTFTVVISLGSCSQSQLVSVTATNVPDLSPIITLPDANFPTNSSKDSLVRIFEVGWVATPPNSVTITVTAPIGYSLVFNEALTSINETGGNQNSVTVNNADWSVINDLAGS
ncbi:hypothetical protein [Spirosoma foliorum]|uniref:Uncharacterized protein n=1 Tax=Spirosoma foliorum TaxID=2710596 RepID=A0A7G5GWC4_9BACT|nr:hypothetical protein [Spirosoma foliorum]QMW03166.1 hypothetical protein H3H32_35755 [Spirosoma foliorum]